MAESFSAIAPWCSGQSSQPLEDYFPRKAGDPGSKQPFSFGKAQRQGLAHKTTGFVALMEKEEANLRAYSLFFPVAGKKLEAIDAQVQ